jgi:nitrate/nitrite transporter NarK
MCSERSGPQAAGHATGLLMLFGNAGGVLVIVAMQLVRSDASYVPAIWLLVALLLVALGVALSLRREARQVAASGRA